MATITASACSTTIDRRVSRTEGVVAQPLLNRPPSAPIVARRRFHRQRRQIMLETIAVILIILWLLGMVSGYTMGNFIYVLLVIAIVLFLVRLVSGRRVL
jgi:hypothetical protein